MSGTIKVAAVQPALRLGAVEENLVRLEDLIRDAVREHSPSVVTVPEAASSPNVYSRALRGVARPVDGAPMQLFRRLARELDVVVGGGFLARRGADVYGTYVLAEPDGRLHLHDKDIPTMWENNYYTRGDDDGITGLHTLSDAAVDTAVDTAVVIPGGIPVGIPVGIANGWEWARMGTAARLRGRVQLVLGGMCWPSYPSNWRGPAALLARREHALQLQHARELPRQMARLIGAPVVMPSHVGPIEFDTPLAPGLAWRTTMVGETQIVERDGTVLARLTQDDGEAHVAATLLLAPPEPVDPLGPMYWIPSLSVTTRAAWMAMNTHGAVKYRAMKLLRRHPWQSWPGGDLPDETGPSRSAEQPSATTA
ncbi:MAG: carbon-nitrogen hydrolase family protein [Pseudonocardia sp.]